MDEYSKNIEMIFLVKIKKRKVVHPLMNPAQRFQFKMSLFSGIVAGLVTGFLFAGLTKYDNNYFMIFALFVFVIVLFIISLWISDRFLSKDKDKIS